MNSVEIFVAIEINLILLVISFLKYKEWIW